MKNLSKQYNDFNQLFSSAVACKNNLSRKIFYRNLPKNLQNKKLLDLGCGDAQDFEEYQKRGAICHGIDSSENLISKAKIAHPESKILLADMRKISFPKNSFDIVVSKYALGTVPNVAEVFTEVSRVLKKNGTFIYLTTHPMRLFLEQESIAKNYFAQTNVDLRVFGDKFIITEPSHTISDFFSNTFFDNFKLENFSEHFDPQSANLQGRDIYPDFLIVTAKRK